MISILTHSAGLDDLLVVIEHTIDGLKAGVHVPDVVASEHVAPAQPQAGAHIHQALVAAQRGGPQQADLQDHHDANPRRTHVNQAHPHRRHVNEV